MNSLPKQQLKDRAYQFSIDIIRLARTVSASRVNLIIIDQLVRSSTSIGVNVIEAQGASSKKDFAKFFIIALKSANETTYWLNLLNDTTNTNQKAIKELSQKATELAKILGASVITLRKETLL